MVKMSLIHVYSLAFGDVKEQRYTQLGRVKMIGVAYVAIALSKAVRIAKYN
jgi:hypothetical protein